MTAQATLPSETTRTIDRLLVAYGESHQNATNKRIHWVCVPAIVWSIIALLWSIPVPDAVTAVPFANWATLTLAATLIYYLALSPRLAVGFLLFAVASMGVTIAYTSMTCFPLWAAALIVFVVAWFFQFVGHKIEGKKPSFFEDLQFLLVGPAWLLHFLYRKAGLRY